MAKKYTEAFLGNFLTEHEFNVKVTKVSYYYLFFSFLFFFFKKKFFFFVPSLNKIAEYGAFVEIVDFPDQEGFIPISELDDVLFSLFFFCPSI